MTTSAVTPWRDRHHIGMVLHDHRRCTALDPSSKTHPATPSNGPRGGPGGLIRDWPAFTLAILELDAERRVVVIVGPAWPERPKHPALVERYTVGLPAGGEAELKSRLRMVVDARQAAWCLAAGHGALSGCPLHAH